MDDKISVASIMMSGASSTPASAPPVIEIATYAGVDVYECYCRGKESKIVMRRCQDNWVNITQVFKIASFSKTQRTKILEKESNDMKHEKIQGGYGRFQGTWIPLENARYLVSKYKVDDIIVTTILSFIPDPSNLPPRRSKNSVIKKLSPATKITSPSSYNKTPKKSSTAKKPKKRAAVSKRTQPSPLQNLMFQTPQHQQHLQSTTENNSTIIAPEQQTPLNAISTTTKDYATTQKPLQFFPHPQQQPVFMSFHEVAHFPSGQQAKKTKQKQAQQNFQMMKQQLMQQPMPVTIQPTGSHKPTNSSGSNGSSMECFSSQEDPTPMSSRSISPKLRQQHLPLPYTNKVSTTDVSEEEYKEIVLQVLSSDYSSNDPNAIVLPEQLYNPPRNLDINFQIDDQGHTSLHWATAMANVPLVKILLTFNSNLLHYNNRGFNCITKAVFYNNCFKAGVFPQMISFLKPCLITPDANGRLPLHYLVELSVNKSKDPVVINYYMDIILDALAQEDVSLLRTCLNYQDAMGNTVLHLAALNLNLELCNKLCYLGSSMDIMNLENESVTTILAKFNLVPPSSQQTHGQQDQENMHLTVKDCDQTITDSLPHALTSAVQHKELDDPNETTEQMKLSTPLLTTKQATSFVQPADTTININDELSTMSQDPLLTSSILRGTKTPSKVVAIDNTPMLQVTTPGTTIKKVRKPTRLIRSAGKASKLSRQLSELTDTLTSSIDEKITNLELEITKNSECVESIDKSLKHVRQQEQEIMYNLREREAKDFSLEILTTKVTHLRSQFEDRLSKFANSLEKSQALTLATLVQNEEGKVSSEPNSPEGNSPKVINQVLLKLVVDLTLLQFKRKHMIEKICHTKSTMNSTVNIGKYRKLIGMSIDNIDTKLDDIEKDLRMNS